LVADLGGRTRLGANFPARIYKSIEFIRSLEDPDQIELLDSHAEPTLELDHLHEDFLLGLVADGDTLSGPAARDKDLHAEVAEHGVARRLADGGFGARLRLVELRENFLRLLAD